VNYLVHQLFITFGIALDHRQLDYVKLSNFIELAAFCGKTVLC